jgi:hypothetical protein
LGGSVDEEITAAALLMDEAREMGNVEEEGCEMVNRGWAVRGLEIGKGETSDLTLKIDFEIYEVPRYNPGREISERLTGGSLPLFTCLYARRATWQLFLCVSRLAALVE